MTVQTLAPTAEIAAPPTVLDKDPGLFQKNFNQASFQFAHHLAGHPLFELPRLLELSATLPETDVYYDAGDIRVGQHGMRCRADQLSAAQLIDRIENAGAWILLKKTNSDSRYASILDRGLAEVAEMVGPAFPKKMRMQERGDLDHVAEARF